MTSVRRLVAVAVFGTFVLTLVLRPISRFLSAGFSGEGFDMGVLVLAVPGFVLAFVMVAVAASVLVRADDDSDTSLSEAMTVSQTDPTPPANPAEADENPENPDGKADGPQSRPGFLTGQGGTRNKGFEIEEQPPETELDDHMAYLSEQLGEDVLENDVSQEDPPEQATDPTGPTTVPSTCPQPYCEAKWGGGGLFGGKDTGYEVLQDGEQVRCEECGGITQLE